MANTTIIRPKKVFSLRDFKELWDYKELMFFLFGVTLRCAINKLLLVLDGQFFNHS